MKSIEWQQGALVLLDQTKLPKEIEYLHCTDWREVAEAIKMLRVRGAPAIGVAAAYGLILAALEVDVREASEAEKFDLFHGFATELKETRPTAINLAWAIDRVEKEVLSWKEKHAFSEIIPFLVSLATEIEAEDKELNDNIAFHGAEELKKENKKLRILTHCNAGALATAGVGTALGVIRKLFEYDALEQVYADETRPLLQGARLTAFELLEDGIPVTLMTDNMAAYAMQQGLIDAVIVGADRITTEGDVANKIGTYGVAVLAKAHHIPFYVAAPYSTFDFTLKEGKDIPIEMRDPNEVRTLYGVQTAPLEVSVLNPAFDVTPHAYITGIITEKGVLKAPFTESIKHLQELVED